MLSMLTIGKTKVTYHLKKQRAACSHQGVPHALALAFLDTFGQKSLSTALNQQLCVQLHSHYKRPKESSGTDMLLTHRLVLSYQ